MSSDRLGSADCEAFAEGILAQPVNALTSAVYLAAAGVVLWHARDPASRRVPLMGAAGLLALIGLGSIDYHGLQTPVAQVGHDLPIAALLLWLGGTIGTRLITHRTVFPDATRGRWLLLIGAGALAPMTWLLGRSVAGTCAPTALWQWHAAWHLLSAMALTVLVLLLWGGPRDRRADPNDPQ